MVAFLSNKYEESDRALDELNTIIGNSSLLNGRLIEDISVTSSADVVLQHGLDKLPVGYIVVKKSAHCDIYSSNSTTLTLTIRASATSIISIWVF